MERILVSLEQSDLDTLKKLAKQYGVSRSAMLRLMIRLWSGLNQSQNFELMKPQDIQRLAGED